MDDGDIKRGELAELKDDLRDLKPGGQRVPIQFNPETLKLSYSNQLQSQNNASSPPASGSGNQAQPARQFVGQSTTKLTLQLWFDVSAATHTDFMVDDVRVLTSKVLYFMKPRDPEGGDNTAGQRIPPPVRFSWGSFLFDGMVESVEESIEFFSKEGKALRASVALALVQQSIWVKSPGEGAGGPRVNKVPGTQPLKAAKGGQSLQQLSGDRSGAAGTGAPSAGSPSFGNGPTSATGLASGAGVASGAAAGRSWQRIAIANGIENPRALKPGQLIDFTAKRAQILTE